MVARISATTLTGIDAVPVEVEVNKGRRSKERFEIIGLGDNAVKEARDRVQSAMQHIGLELPRDLLVNLAPAEVRKEGSSFDLAIAVGVMAVAGVIDVDPFYRMTLLGELALDGRVKPVRGVVASTICALEQKQKNILVPHANLAEAQLIPGICALSIESLPEIISFCEGELDLFHTEKAPPARELTFSKSLAEVWGQHSAKRALLLAAAGGHNVLFIGPPGCGKSMLAERFPTILPPLSETERREVVKVQSASGLPVQESLAGMRPFRSPHHVISEAGMVGGGSVPRPGEISLAHRGVLFLDEFPEYRRGVLESLRGPLETGFVQVARAKGSYSFPADFQLIAAMNPCPCGRRGADETACSCAPGSVVRYLQKLSQPILDRIDLHVELEPVPPRRMLDAQGAREREVECLPEQVRAARERQLARQGLLNARLPGKKIKESAQIEPEAIALLEQAAKTQALSARGFMKVLRVARTAADLSGKDKVSPAEVAEAVQFRSLERLLEGING